MKKRGMSLDTAILDSLLSPQRVEVDRMGRVFDRDRQDFREPTIGADGHAVINIDGIGVVRVARLVALTFYLMPPAGKRLVMHKNGNVSDNRADNICWASPKEISDLAHRLGWVPHPVGECLPTTKLTAEKVFVIREMLSAGYPKRAIAEEFGVTHGAIDGIKYRKSWRHL